MAMERGEWISRMVETYDCLVVEKRGLSGLGE